MTAPDPFLTARELAAWLNVPAATVKDWRRRRTGPPSLKVGGAVRYRPADVEAWLELHDVVADLDRALDQIGALERRLRDVDNQLGALDRRVER